MVKRLSWLSTFLCSVALCLSACGGNNEDNGEDACTVVEAENSATITCPDGTSATVEGIEGPRGPVGGAGPDGEDADPCTVTDNGDGTAELACPDGSSVTVVTDPGDFEDESCELTVDEAAGTATITCADGTTATVDIAGEGGEDETCTATDNGDGTATIACPGEPDVTVSTEDTACTLTDNGDGTADLSCPDGTTLTVPTTDTDTFCGLTDNGDGTATITCPDGTTVTVTLDGGNQSPTARVQVIHASADSAASIVDVYANDSLLIDDIDFRDGTGFFPVPAGAALDIDITGANAADSSNPVYTQSVGPLTANENYILIATGNTTAAAGDPDAFRLVAVPQARTSAATTGNVDILVAHASADTPAVDVDVDNTARLGGALTVTNLAFGAFTEDGSGNASYISVDPTMTLFSDTLLTDVLVNASGALALNSQVPNFSSFANSAVAVVATGQSTATPSTLELTAFPAVTEATPNPQPGVSLPRSARLQAIHNAPDPAAATVDIYLNDRLYPALDDFGYKEALPYLSVPSGVSIDLDVAGSGSTNSMNPIFTQSLGILNPGDVKVAVANGVLDPTMFDQTVNMTIAFEIATFDGKENADMAMDVDLQAFHGISDAPTVGARVDTGAGPPGLPLISGLAYGDALAVYSALPGGTPSGTLEVFDDANPNTVLLSVPNFSIAPFAGEAVIVLASGFVAPVNNQNGPAAALILVQADGTVTTL